MSTADGVPSVAQSVQFIQPRRLRYIASTPRATGKTSQRSAERRPNCGSSRASAPKSPEAVEKVGFSEENVKLGDRKRLGAPRKSFVELPGAIQLLQISHE